MNTQLVSFAVALIMGIGLVAGIGLLSLLSGSVHFFANGPKFHFLKSTKGTNYFAFGFTWDADREPAKIDSIKLRLFNPFGNPTQLEFTKVFDAASFDFARELEMVPSFGEFTKAKNFDEALVQIEISSTKDGFTHQLEMKGKDFLKKSSTAKFNVSDFLKSIEVADNGPEVKVPERTFISPALPKPERLLKLATNPEFAGQFAGGAAETQAVKENFSVSKVWIEPGCIVCNACEGIFPEVFEVTDSTCLIRAGAPLNDGLKIQEAAEACPVEVIKFNRA